MALVFVFYIDFLIIPSKQSVMLPEVSPKLRSDITRSEGFALIFAVTKFHKIIFGRKFIFQTDHKPLTTIFGCKKIFLCILQTDFNVGHFNVGHFNVKLLAYDFDIEYIRTSEFGHVDMLSRLINRNHKSDEDFVVATV